MKIGLHLALATDCHPERSERSVYDFGPPSKQRNKQILRRCAPQNDIAPSLEATGGKGYPNFRRRHEGHEGL